MSFLKRPFPLFLIGLYALLSSFEARSAPLQVYSFWDQEKTTGANTIVFHTLLSEEIGNVYFSRRPCWGKKECYEESIQTKGSIFEWGERRVHHASITELETNQEYYFIAGGKKEGFSKEKKFRTLPKEEPLRFVAGGDIGVSRNTKKLLEQAAKLKPHFLIFGGDLAYGNARKSSVKRWDLFLGLLSETVSKEELTPMIAAIGNHEVRGRGRNKPPLAPFYKAYFQQAPGSRTYFKRSLPRDLSLYILDSGHLTSHGGKQLAWLKDELEKDKSAKWKLAAYHVPLFPSYRPFSGRLSQQGRKHWLPLFEKHDLAIGFENHDHTLKRTKPIRNGKPAEDGIIFLGDGSMGHGVRRPKPERNYLAQTKSVYHFWYGEISDQEIHLKAIGLEGEVLDEVTIKKETSKEEKP